MIIEIIKDLTALLGVCLWPVFTFCLVCLYRNELRQILSAFGELIPRITKGHIKVAGQEFDADLSQLHAQVVMAEAEAAANPTPSLPNKEEIKSLTSNSLSLAVREDKTDLRIALTLEQAKSSPRLALITLSASIEDKIHEVTASLGLLTDQGRLPIMRAVQMLADQGQLNEHIMTSLLLFQDVRNRIIHGFQEVDPEAILSAIDSGVTILKTLNAIPFERYYVQTANVPLYSDPSCKNLLPHSCGVILRVVNSQGNSRLLILPTTKQDYEKDQQVGWEWNNDLRWNSVWYRNPSTEQIVEAWQVSSEFVGRPLPP